MTTETLLDKNQVINSFQNLPEQVTADELIERILFLRLIDERLRETTEVPHEQVMQELRELKERKLAESRKEA